MVSITDVTRRFRIHDYVVETWMEEGILPGCVWRNGRRYWSSDDINALIAGCPIAFPKAKSSIKKFSRRPGVANFLSGAVAFLATLVTR